MSRFMLPGKSFPFETVPYAIFAHAFYNVSGFYAYKKE